jgi:diguanylate cyclase (GGDEF)-like protein
LLGKDSKLREVTANTLKRILRMDIVMPSDYLVVFKDELHDISSESLDLEELVKAELLSDLHKSTEIIKSTEKLIKSTSEILVKSVEAIEEKNAGYLNEAKDEINALMKKIQELSKDIYTDELTSVLNRKWFFREFLVDESFAPVDGIISFIDLNKLKSINDTLGHKVGDKALVYFSQFMKRMMKNGKFIRFAGDEFLVVFEETDLKKINKLLENAYKDLEKVKLKTVKDSEEVFLRLSFSYGSAKFKKGDEILSIIEEADQNMYRMKELMRARQI